MNPRILFLLVVLAAVIVLFAPTAMVTFFGLMPTWAVMAGDRSRGKLKTLAVGAVNFGGVSYVLMELWAVGHSFDNATLALMNTKNLIIMYFSAAAGFAVQRAMTGIVSAFILENTKRRHKKLTTMMAKLEERWGTEVNGSIPLDHNGFPIEASE